MALDDIEEQLEELEESEEKDKREEGRPGQRRETRHGGGVSGLVRKAGVVVAVCVVGLLAYFLLRPSGGKGGETLDGVTTHEFGDQTLNLRDGRTALKLNVVVEVNDARCLGDVVSQESLLRDKVIEIFSRKGRDEIDSVVERNKVKRELLDDFNVELDMDDGRLTRVFFREFFYYDLAVGQGN